MSLSPASDPGALLRLRLSLLYALSFGSLGAVFPFLALRLREDGVGGMLLLVALSAQPAMRLLAGPAWGVLSDRYRIARGLLGLGAGLAAIGAALLASGPATSLLGALLFAFGRAPLDTMLEGMTLSALGSDQLAYGRIRLWGSVGFLLAGLSSGWLLDSSGITPMHLGAGLCALMLLLVATLPRAQGYRPEPIGPALRSLWGAPGVPWLLGAGALHFLSHAGATTFLAVHLAAQGAPQTWTGLTLAVGVGAEISLMAAAPRLLSRWPTGTVFLAAIAVALPRWLLNAALPDPLAVLILQSLHGITFGAFWVSAVARIGAASPPEVRTSAMSLLGAAVAGVGALGGNLIGAAMIERATTRDLFLVMAGVSALAILAGWRAVHASADVAR